MSSLNETFDMFFGEWDEERAVEELALMSAQKQEVDTARSANDWKTLKKLGFAQQIDHPTREGAYRWEFAQSRYEQLCEELNLTPKALAAKMNQSLY